MMAMQKMRQSMVHLRPNSGITQKYLEPVSRRRVALLRRSYIACCVLKKTHYRILAVPIPLSDYPKRQLIQRFIN
jgi:hypothetical protein